MASTSLKIVHICLVFYILYQATEICVVFLTVQFYGHGKTEDSSLPIKTDKDTLREGYR